MRSRFKVGDKVQTNQSWGPSYYFGIVLEVRSYELVCNWYEKPDGSVYQAIYPKDTLYLLENKKKGICKFLDKVQKEYAQ